MTPAPMPVPLTRRDALAAWAEFLPAVPAYAHRRNHLEPHYRNVSRLSAALRYRLLLEDEVVDDTLRRHGFSAAEKWLQEVCWRRYWKGWLEMRPDVWTSWRQRVRGLRETLPAKVMQRARAVATGASGVACMDAIARELMATGYLHNHARMWWASYWIHVECLPWEMGADWFFRQLLDADPASNTLSWRWVAGLQTPGKTYLVKESNIQKFAPDLLHQDDTGSDRLADRAITPACATEFADTTRQPLAEYPAMVPRSNGRLGLWLHEDDLLLEAGPLTHLTPVSIGAFLSEEDYRHTYALSEQRIAALGAVLADGVARAAVHFRCPTVINKDADSASSLVQWAADHRLNEVAAFAPTVGPVADLVPRLRQILTAHGIQLTLIRRPSDTHAFTMASAGFFPFWKKMSRHLQASKSMNMPASFPTMHQRMAMQKRPNSFVVGRQRWSHLLFLHWRVSADAVQATLPSGLFVDTFEGDAHIGIVPFFMERVRPAWLPPLPWISWFLELNVRTYVHDRDGRPGVWFYSLDCNQPVAVAIAQRFFHLPYLHARMSAKQCHRAIQYQCQRRGQNGEPWHYEWSPGTHAAPAEPGTLEFHLIERYVLFCADRKSRIYQGRVHHMPYRIHIPVVSSLSTGPARLAGFDLEGEPVSVLGAMPVDVSIFPLKPTHALTSGS